MIQRKGWQGKSLLVANPDISQIRRLRTKAENIINAKNIIAGIEIFQPITCGMIFSRVNGEYWHC